MRELSSIQLANASVYKSLLSFIKGRMTPLLYAGSSVATTAAQLISSLIIIKFVMPEDLGLWQSVRLAQVYAFLLLAGTNNGLGRELPFSLGKGDLPFSENLLATALYCSRLMSAVVLVCGVCCAAAFAGSGTPLVYAILAIAVIIALAFYQSVIGATFRAKDSFKNLTIIQMVEAGLSIGTIPMVYFYHYNGMLMRTVLISGIVVALLHLYRPMKVKSGFDLGALKVLLKTGMPIFALDYMRNSAATLDRLVLLKIGGVKDVGLYALANMATQAIAVLPNALSTYTYPRGTYKFGRDNDSRALWGFVVKFLVLAAVVTTPAVLCGWVVLPWFVSVFAPKYVEGIQAARIVLIVGVFDCSLVVVQALWSMKAWRLMTAYQALSSVTYAFGPVTGCLIVGPSLEGVAWGMVAGSLARGLFALGLTYYGTHGRRT